jgi:hypothetical protein
MFYHPKRESLFEAILGAFFALVGGIAFYFIIYLMN